MKFAIPNPGETHAGLRALATMAQVDGALDPAERGLLDAAGHVFRHPVDVSALAPIEPDELAGVIETPGVGFQLVGAMVVMAMADGDVVPAEAELLRRFADALNVDTSAVNNLDRIAKGQRLYARLDILRRQWAIKKLQEVAAEAGPRTYVDAVLGMLRLKADPALTQRYLDLGKLPTGSLGRAYFDYMVRNQFAFPGERGAPPEVMIHHDMTHILSGYGTTPEEEILAATFSAGYSSYEVHNWMVFVLSQFQLGVQTAPNVPPERLQMNPQRTIAAYRRGCEMTLDLNSGWDPWKVMGDGVDELRERYSIRPESEFWQVS